MSTKQEKKLGIGVSYALQIIEEGNRPMSIDQIKSKYQLEFPFTVRRALPALVNRWDCGCTRGLTIGELMTCLKETVDNRNRRGVLIGRCNCGDELPLNPSIERYVLAEALAALEGDV